MWLFHVSTWGLGGARGFRDGILLGIWSDLLTKGLIFAILLKFLLLGLSCCVACRLLLALCCGKKPEFPVGHMTVNFMCQFDWEAHVAGKTVFLGVSVRVFPEEVSL